MTVNERATVEDFRLGLMLAVGSAFAFGSSGPFAKALMEAGWSPTAAVVARLAGGALVMAVFATIARPGWVGEALRHTRTVVLYGAIPIAGAQLFYYNAVAHLSVGVALLLEYTAPILVVGWVWTTTRRGPAPDTGRRRIGGSRNHVGAQRVQRRRYQPGRHRLGTGRRGVRRVLLRDVGQRRQRLRRQRGRQPRRAGRRWPGGRRRCGHAPGRRGHHAADVHDHDTVIAGWTTSWVVPVVALRVVATRSRTRSASWASPCCGRGSRRWSACPR